MHSWIDLLIAFGIGIFAGAFAGMMVTALMVAASDRDREEEHWDE